MTQPEDEIERTVALLRRTLEQRVTPEVRARHLGSVQRKAGQMRLEQRRNQRAARRPRVALLAALVGAMLVGTSSAALAASGSTVPGDALYPVKRGGEEVRLLVATPFSAQGGVQIDIATERVYEAGVVAEEHPEKVLPLIAEFQEAIAAAEAVGAPQVADVAGTLTAKAGAALAVAEVATSDIVAALPRTELSDEIVLATDSETTTALANELTRSGTIAGTSPVPGEVETDPLTGMPETVTTSPSASASASTSASPSSPSLSPSPSAPSDT